jgi:NTE family protein
VVRALNDSNQLPEKGRGTDSRIWVIMGGGAAKGFAHVGAWKAIQEAEIPVAGIIGTSTGAMMGAAFAGGRSVEELEEHSQRFRRRDVMKLNRRSVWINGIRCPSMFRGDTLRRFILDVLPTEQWLDLTIPLMVNAVDLASGDTVWFGHGSDQEVALLDAVYASAALPVIFPPADLGGRVLIDGGASDMLPLGKAAEMGATRIIAIDVGAGPQTDAREVVAGGLVAIHQRVFSLMAGQRRRESVRNWTGVPLTHVQPEFEDTDGFDFERRHFFIEEGYRATREALAGRQSSTSTSSAGP